MPKAVAILGKSFTLPSSSSGHFEQDLLDGKNLISAVAPDRWCFDSFLHSEKSHPGTAYSFDAGSVGDVSQFDATFFGISPREAAQIDPQHRLLLEMSWLALEDAGIKPSSLRGSACGVYIGISSADYSYRLAEDMASIDSSVATGTTASIAANRISYFFDLRGPSMAIDTACSSSLVAFHQACQAIRSGEITHALTGGVSLHLHPLGFIVFSKASMLSPNGNCNVFDDDGNGYVRSEGGGVLVLKDYDLALADGDRILAVVAQSTVNTDGKKNGLTVPKTLTQAELLTSAYSSAGIPPDAISYIEAHGTGTAVGDPIEALALGQALGTQRRPDRPLLIGSVKSNLGHLEAASGIAGLAKALFVIERRKIPATIGIKTFNTRIDFKGLNLDVVTETRALPKHEPVVVGINSFGFGGANAHVILRDHPGAPEAPKFSETQHTAPIPFLISAASQLALRSAASNLAQVLSQHSSEEKKHQPYLYDTAYQLAFRREAFKHRAIVFANIDPKTNDYDIVTLCSRLHSFADDAQGATVVSGVKLLSTTDQSGPNTRTQGPAFFYSGNGSQWLGMGRALLADPTFNQAIKEIDQTFIHLAGFCIADQLQGLLPELSYENTDIAQPALFAVQVGVTKMLAAMGVRPQAVAGHSVGEVAAAWAAGILDLKAAVEVIYHRSHLQQTTKGLGNMSAVATGVDTAMRWLAEERLSKVISIAGINSDRGLTLAGTAQSLAKFEMRLTKERVGFKRLALDYAFHSPEMDSIQTAIEEALSHLTPKTGDIAFYSSVTGGLLDGTALTAEYWWKNIRQPVLFESATNQLLSAEFQVLVEIGPHPVLKSYLNDCLEQQVQRARPSLPEQQFQPGIGVTGPGTVLASLSRQQDQVESVQAIAGQVWVAGATVDLSAFFPVVGQHVRLPTYPWQKERHWHGVSAESPNTLNRIIEHPLLGYRVPQHHLLWENQLDPYRQAFLADHVVGDSVVFPGTGYVELALAAAHAWRAEGVKQLEDLEIFSPLTFDSGHGKVLRVGIDAADGRVSIQSRELLSSQDWILNARARIILDSRFSVDATENALQPQSLEHLALRRPDFDTASHLRLTRIAGLQYGEAFEAIKYGWLGRTSTEPDTLNDCVTALFKIPESLVDSIGSFHIHPALLDCAFQLIIQLLRDRIDLNEGIAFVPTQARRISLQSGLGAPHHVKARLLRTLPSSILAEFTLFDADGHALVRIEGARFKRVRLHTAGAAKANNIHTRYIPSPLQPGMRPSSVSYPLIVELTNEAARLKVLDPNYRIYIDELDPLLDALCSAFAVETLAQLGFSENTDHNSIRLQQLTEQSPDTAPLLQHLIKLALEEGQMTQESDGLKFRQTELHLKDQSSNNKIDALSIWNTLIADYPDYFCAVHTVGKVGKHLSRIVTGEESLMQVLGTAQGVATLTDTLIGNRVKGRLTKAVREAVKDARQRLTPNSRLGFLEVAAVKPALSCELGLHEDASQCDVIFACPAVTELATGHELAEHSPNLQLASFAHANQSGAAGTTAKEPLVDLAFVWLQFDSAALNGQAVDYAIRRLKPGGTLLIEGQHPARWLDFAFGGRTDWWSESDNNKKISMQRSRSQWESRLASLGLENVQHMKVTREATGGDFLLIAHSPLAATTQPHRHESPRSWLLITDHTQPHQRLADTICAGLQRQGDMASVLSLTAASDEAAEIAHHIAAMQADFGQLDGIIHLQGMGAAYQTGTPTAAINRCISVAKLIQACQLTDTKTPVWLITQRALIESPSDPGNAEVVTENPLSADVMLGGFVRSLNNEVSTNRLQLIDLNTDVINQQLIEELIHELIVGSHETEVILSNNQGRFVPRLELGHRESLIKLSVSSEKDTCTQLKFTQPGQLRNLQWQLVRGTVPSDDEVEIEVEATGLNFRDVMYAQGLLSDEAIENGFAGPTLGLECSGKILRLGKTVTHFAVGDRVVGFGPACFANRVVTKASAVSHIPRSLSTEAAVTIPSTFLTSYYALVHMGRLAPGEKILIHGAAGGVGLAAIQIARRCGAEIFATAGSDEKRELLHMLGVEHVLDSRSLSFAEDIMTITKGIGIDMVLNSLAGEAINRNLSILKPFGRFLELGKRDFYENTRIGLRPFRNNITYFGIDADQLMNDRPELTAKLFSEVMDLFDKGLLYALPYTRFEARDVLDAFRFMQRSKQIGKIVVTYRNGIPASNTHISASAQSVYKKAANLKLDPLATYLVTGGLGGFGLRSAHWLAEKGARQLILLGRRDPDTVEARAGIEALTSMGVTVSAHACDITDGAALSKILERSLPRLKGVIHAAAVIEDSLVENLSPAQLARVLNPKVAGAMNLHHLTQKQTLDFFVMYSSATTLFGNPGQAAYVAANCGLEALATQRRAKGLAATCMLWGAIDDAGFLARNQRVKEDLQRRMGGQALSSAHALEQLEDAIIHNRTNEGVLNLDFSALSKFLPSAQSPRFSELARFSLSRELNDQSTEDISQLLSTLDDTTLAVQFIEMVKQELAKILRIASEKIDASKSTYDMGLDSLMGVELVVALEARFGVRLSVMAISENPSIEKLAYRLLEILRAEVNVPVQAGHTFTPQSPSSANAHSHVTHVTELVKQHGSDSNAEDIAALAESLNTQIHQPGRFLQ